MKDVLIWKSDLGVAQQRRDRSLPFFNIPDGMNGSRVGGTSVHPIH